MIHIAAPTAVTKAVTADPRLFTAVRSLKPLRTYPTRASVSPDVAVVIFLSFDAVVTLRSITPIAVRSLEPVRMNTKMATGSPEVACVVLLTSDAVVMNPVPLA